MKKLNKLFLMGAVALGLGLTACNSGEVNGPVDESKANTHVSVTLSMSTKGTRALPDDYNKIGEWTGKDKIETIAVYLVDGTTVNAKTFNVGSGLDYEVVNNAGTITIIPKKETAAIKTTAGTKKVYVLINGSAEVAAHLNKTPVAEFEDAYQKVALALANQGNATTSVTSASKLAKVDTGEDVIVMTNVQPEPLVVKPNISAAQTIGANAGETAKNRVTLNVERSVARVMVTIANNQNFTVPANGTGTVLGTISNVTWVLAQGENSLYVQRKAQWETPNYAWMPTSTEPYLNAANKYDYSGLFEGYQPAPNYGGTPAPSLADYTTVTPGSVGSASILSGKFILPTTHAIGDKTTNYYKKGNTAYVLVRAHFTPSATAYADGGTYTTGADFFVGANGKFYTSYVNAVDPTKGGVAGQTAARYVGGKVLYYAWVNPDEVATQEWYNSPVLRNNIYHIHITGFKTIGTNWNPLFPEDPDNPKTPANGGNPDPKPSAGGEPENPIDPEDPLTTPETWMSVDVTVLPWLVHSYQVDLGI